jgi:hypothetical protein
VIATSPEALLRKIRAVSQLLWPDKDREVWFSLGENHEKASRFGLHQLRNCLRFLIFAGAASLASQAGNGVSPKPVRSVPICSGVSLSANYLALAGPDQGPGFRFVLVNRTGREIKLAEPVPSSSHWYARTKGRWLWRASNGAGGSLVDAGNEHGRVVVYAAPAGAETKLLTLPPHQSREWIESQQENPVLEYKPGCPICSYPGEREYQVVFAYAYLAVGSQPAGLLSCGLRSAPVPMPPKS